MRPLLCDPKLFEKSLIGKTYVITGSNSGIGLITAKQIAKQGGRVILACRRVNEAEKAISQAISEGINQDLMTAMLLDLGDLNSVKSFAENFKNKYKELHGLVNNAGVMNTANSQTKQGFELQIGINHLGHFLLTELLLELLKSSAPSRIVNISSCFHDKAMGKEGVISLDDLNFKNRKYNGWEAYAQSKLANLIHARGLAKHLQGSGVTAVSVHPGWVRTNLARNSMPLWVQNILLRPILSLMGMIEPWEGAQTTLHCLLDDDVPNHSGEFYSQLGIYRDRKFNKGGWPMVSPNPQAHDDKLRDQFWDLSSSLVKA